MRRFLTIAVVLCLATTALGSASAKKKRRPKPYTSERAEVSIGHSQALLYPDALTGVTALEFTATCEIPRSNGFDAYVFEVPAPYQRISSTITAHGDHGFTFPVDPDIYLYTESCELAEAYFDVGPDETGRMPPGRAYAVIVNGVLAEYQPATLWFELAPEVKQRSGSGGHL